MNTVPHATPAEAIGHLESLLLSEQAEDLREYREALLDTPLKERQRRGVSWFPVRLYHSRIGQGGRFVLELRRDIAYNQPHQFQPGSQASVFPAGQQGEGSNRLTGQVLKADNQSMELQVQEEDLPDWIDDHRLGIDLLFDENSYREMKAALRKLLKAPEKSRLQILRDVLLGFREPAAAPGRGIPLPASGCLAGLNDSQKEAIAAMWAAEDVFCIHGPPGTGKTTTLVAAVESVAATGAQVLVCAPSNAAADLLTEKIAARNLKVLRAGNPARISEDIIPFTVDYLFTNHPEAREIKRLRKLAWELKRMAYSYKKYYDRSEREQKQAMLKEARSILDQINRMEAYVLDGARDNTQVFVSTLVGAALPVLRGKTFPVVFIDEAGQALEPANWIPVVHAEKVVLAGDHCQLPPTVKSRDAMRLGLSETLMEKFCRREVPGSAVMLTTQYRMHEKIMGFSSDYFYGSRLKADPAVAGHGFARKDAGIWDPFVFIDTAGTGYGENFHPESAGLSNASEGALLYRHLKSWLEEAGESPSFSLAGFSLAIISPYREQVEWLRREYETMAGNYPELRPRFGTVDGFQGQESDLVYISLVRSNNQSEIGFLRDIRRMNVALTRARKRLVVVGDSATISAHPFYHRLLEYAETHGHYQSAWDFPDF